MQTFEVGIIGGGPGGYVTALRLHQYGINTILFEKERLGGVCLNWGCIPTKAMVRAADLFAEICRAEEFGIVTSSPRLDYTKFLEHRQQVVESLVTGIEFLFRKKKITLVKEEVKKISRVDDHYRININGNEFNMQYLVLATGSEPKALANIQPDGHHVLTSRDLLDLKKLPASLTVIGGGVIGCEFASLLTDLGVAVEIVEFLPDLVSSEDREISRRLLAALRKKGIRVHLHNAVNNIEMEKGKVRLHLSSGQIINTSKVLLSVGRNPVMSISFTDGGPAEEKGFIRVNNEMRTNLSNVFAIGDVTGKLMLAHTASKQGMIVADIIRSQLRGDSGIGWDLEYTDIPRCTYTTPEIGSVGLTEEQARMKFGEIRMGRFLFSACGKAIAIRQTFGFVKIISTVDGAIVGLHIIGPQATELIAQGAILLGMKAGLTDVKKIVFAHPTLSEAIMEACEDSEGLAIHKI